MVTKRIIIGTLIGAVVAGLAAAGTAVAGEPQPWQMNLMPAQSPVMERVHEFHNLLLVIQVGIVLLVLGLLGYIIFRFNAKRNPVPSRTSHNTLLEVIWTAVPVVILVIIAIPGLRLLYFHDRAHEYDFTVKVTGHQWYWSYTYPDHGDFTFTSIMVPDDELQEGQPRLLAVDNPVVVPVGTNVQILVVSDDVIHAWAVPSLGVKVDATPGRVNERWLHVHEEGTYYGMCSELCGINHAFMPIQLEAVSPEAFEAWVEETREEWASRQNAPGVRVAAGDGGADVR
ncbi:MAG: cytochrome c oxidase subunit II [Rhodospirillales bacterium]|nr:MAG: cytochrome c oxidase subunit II [Rhodospirillales bacterium]